MMKNGLLVLACSVLLLVLGGVAVNADTCPGGHERCPDFMTCCKLANGNFGCCPFPDAKCCPDHVHCCPHNMECDVTHQSCMKNGSPVQFYWRVPIQPEIVEPVVAERTLMHQDTEEVVDLQQFKNENTCPDASKCQSTFTCCKMYSGKYGCCPFDNGTCCQDRFHCCPHGSTCSASGECYSMEMNYTVNAYPMKDKKYEKFMKTKQEHEKALHQDISDPGGKCPDGRTCPERFTCCRIEGKRFGCCPYKDAQCCEDGIHCCPKGTNCNDTLGICDIQKNFQLSFPNQALVNLQWSEAPKTVEISNHIKEAVINDIVCPDERYRCPDGTTCCQLGSGAYGCCPMERATCCSDKEHCCPFGYKCTTDGCQKGTHFLPPFLRTTASVRDSQKIQQKNFQWSYPNQAMVNLQWSEAPKTVEISNHIEEVVISDVVCPDERYHCPDGTTCCPLGSGVYGCCLMEKAICCSDKEHCCPFGYKCITDGCQKGTHFLPPFLRTTASVRDPQKIQIESKEIEEGSDVICPDLYPCPDHNTCCQLASGEYGCCPMEKATCCPDKIHCCPNGYRCISDGCKQNAGASWILPQFLSAIAISSRGSEEPKTEVHEEMLREDEGIVCPDKKSSCPDGTTCCELESGAYGCCPMEDATCCGDQIHCCPHGFWCSDDGCERMPGTPLHLLPFLHKLFNARKIMGN